MSTVTAPLQTTPAVDALDRWFFTAMGVVLTLIAVIGFAPNSAAILTGEAPNPALAVHVHAALMVAWLVLFVLQAGLVARGSPALHRRLGRCVFALGPAIVVMLAYMAITRFGGNNPFELPVQVQRILFFGGLLALAVRVLRSDSGAHKRFMLLATIVPIDAGLNRMSFLPDFGLGWGTPLWMPVLVMLLVLHDLRSLGQVHRATVVGGGPIVVFWSGIVVWLAASG